MTTPKQKFIIMHTNTIVISVHTNTESYTYTHQIKVQRRNRKTLIWDAVGYSVAVRSTIFHPFPHRIILIIERKMGQLVNEIAFFTHRCVGDLLKSETKVVVDIDKLIKSSSGIKIFTMFPYNISISPRYFLPA